MIPGCACLPRYHKKVLVAAVHHLINNPEAVLSFIESFSKGNGKARNAEPVDEIILRLKEIEQSLIETAVCEDYDWASEQE